MGAPQDGPVPYELDVWVKVCLNVLDRHCTAWPGEGREEGGVRFAMRLLSVCRMRDDLGGKLVLVSLIPKYLPRKRRKGFLGKDVRAHPSVFEQEGMGI